MICPHCKRVIQDDSVFCPVCGVSIDSAQTDMKYCPKCGKEIEFGSSFCKYCGTDIRNTENILTKPNFTDSKTAAIKEKKHKKKIKPLVAVVSVLAALVVTVGAWFGTNYIVGLSALDNMEYIRAMKCFDNIGFVKSTMPDMYKYALYGKFYESGKLCSKDTYLKLISLNSNSKTFKIPDDVIDYFKEIVYQDACQKYQDEQNGKADQATTAMSYFALISHYKDSDKYITLIKASSCEDVLEIIDFKNAKEVLVSDSPIAEEFLSGTWKTAEGAYYFSMQKSNDGSYDASYNLPWIDMSDSYFRIRDGIFFLYEKSKDGFIRFVDINDVDNKYVFKFTVIDRNEISVYCYKNGSTYKLFRQ